tara:strand:- start:718 stop:1377 length:660 start_codon:yes stop_codon:yes gene_type:complete
MLNRNKLYGFKLDKNSDYLEIGGGTGDLSFNMKNKGFNIILFIEPDKKKFEIASNKLEGINCLNININEFKANQISPKTKILTVIMQDVIEHIHEIDQKLFFNKLFTMYEKINFIGRTPNLKSPFGLRNSFGDNTHLHRFTDKSLRDFLKNIEFENIIVSGEGYRVTGIVSFLRYPAYFLILLSSSIIFFFVFGSWEGFLTPNITFKSEKFKYHSTNHD